MTDNNFMKFFTTDFAKSLPTTAAFPFDIKSLMDIQRKNLQAFTEAQHLIAESFQTIAARQTAIISELVESNATLARGLLNEGTPEEKIAKQADMAKSSYEKSVAHWGELSDIASKSGKQAAEILHDRVGESLTELKSSLNNKSTGSAVVEANTNQQRKKAA